ncbi:MAG: hypothetical protein Kow0077_31890 [Anaerolineae bacterium]
MLRTLLAGLLVGVLLAGVLPVLADGDGRLNPGGAEYYTVYCRDDLVFAYRADGQYVLRAPIAYLLGLADAGGRWESGAVTVTRNGDVITIGGTNGNRAPEYGEKRFTLTECLARNGATPAPQTPPKPRASVPVANPCVYTVREGDAAFAIADRFNTSVTLLAQHNRIADISLIYVGQVLNIPGCAGVAAGVTVQTDAAAGTATRYAGTLSRARGGRTHTVRAGEALAWIADRYNVTVDALAAANGIENPNLVWEGAVLTIP